MIFLDHIDIAARHHFFTALTLVCKVAARCEWKGADDCQQQ
jgi:hypothetical protein